MEQVSTSQPPHSASPRCAVCETTLDGDRCGHCGAAARAGPYTVQRLLSQNAQGRVYLAVDEAGAEVALKELVYTMVPSVEELEAFARETELLAQLSHPRIPRFLKGFTVGQGAHTRLYLAQQLVKGESLEQKLTHHRFSEDEVTGLARQVLEVLSFLHDRRPAIVHRDLKPANLIVSPEGMVHLIDFGTARDVKQGGTHRSTLVGTVGYMAPEQLGGSVSPKSDLYGLGATLAHLLTRKPPEELCGAGLTIDVTRLGVSAGMRGFLSGLVAARAEDRYEDAHQAIRALTAGRRLNATSKKLTLYAVAASAVVALLSGIVVIQVQQPPRVLPAAQPPAAEVVAPPPKPPVVQPPAPGDPQPVVRLTPFSWQLASWEFDKPGPWLLDTTGHRHSVPFPARGYSVDFFGPLWDGTQGAIVVPDAPAFALEHPFLISVRFNRLATSDGKAPPHDRDRLQHLITRGDWNGRFAFDLSLQGHVVYFTVMDEHGHSDELKANLETATREVNLYAQLDTETGDMWLHKSGDCKPLAHKKTQVRPAKTVPNGQVRLIEGFDGRVNHISLQRGLMLPNREGPPGESCGFSGQKLTPE